MSAEIRFCELRAEGERILTGVAIRYGDVATLPWGSERFEAGAFDVGGSDVILNAQHARDVPLARTGGGGLELRDSPESLTIRAELPETRAADDVLTLVRGKILRGLSVEFHAKDEAMVGGVRVIRKAILEAVGVVDRGAYPDSIVAAMRSKYAAEAAQGARKRRFWL